MCIISTWNLSNYFNKFSESHKQIYFKKKCFKSNYFNKFSESHKQIYFKKKCFKMVPSFGPPKWCFNVLFDCFDFKKPNSALPNSILCTLVETLRENKILKKLEINDWGNKNTFFSISILLDGDFFTKLIFQLLKLKVNTFVWSKSFLLFLIYVKNVKKTDISCHFNS